ncbi:MAG: hypothetical protein ACOX2F_10670 [bacterium]
MGEKLLLLFETNELLATKVFDFLREAQWEIHHKQDLEPFLEALQSQKFNLVIAEESKIPKEIIPFLVELDTPVILSTSSAVETSLTTIGRDFSSAELTNAIGKANFLRIVRLRNETFKEENDENEPVILGSEVKSESPAPSNLTQEESNLKAKSSWREPEESSLEEAPLLEKKVEQKKDIFDKIDELDSILTSLNKDISATETSSKPTPKPHPKPGFVFGDKEDDSDPEATLPVESLQTEKKLALADEHDKSADYLFSDSYASQGKGENQDSFHNLDFETNEKESPDVSNTKTEEFEIESHEEKVKASEPPESSVSVQTSQDLKKLVEEIAKEEIKNWLEKNGQKAIKETVLEQLSKFSKENE